MNIIEILKKFIGKGKNNKVLQLEAGKEIIEDNNNELRDTAKEFRERLVKEGNEIKIENMPQNEAIIAILRKNGLKDEIANNKDAVKAIVELTKEIHSKENINLEQAINYNLYLPEINEDGSVSIDYLDKEYSKSSTIDVNEKGQTVLSSKQKYNKNENNGYAQIDIDEIKTIENGVEMRKEYKKEKFGVVGGTIDKKIIEDYIVERNPDLITANVILKNHKYKGVNVEGQIILDGLEPCSLSTSNSFETDIKKVQEAREKHETPEGFKYEGENRKIRKAEAEKEKRILKTNVDLSPEFRNLAEKKGLVKPEKERG